MAETRIFGLPHGGESKMRVGAYIIPVSDGRCAVTKTEKGYFLLGGCIEPGETDLECIRRECMEEVGRLSAPDALLGVGLTYFSASRGSSPGGLEQRYYSGSISEPVARPSESGNELVWLSLAFAEEHLHLETQRWAVKLSVGHI